MPLEVPHAPWCEISWDFITGLPTVKGNSQILVIVDRFSKMAHFVPLPEKVDAPSMARVFIDQVWKHHGLPESIVSDRGPTFASEFWRTVCSILGARVDLSTAFHPQTDGQTERVNQTLE